jgi:hypothetical protein
MRLALILAALCSASAASAEIWSVREGECGEWQSRWDVQQEQSGVWVGVIDHFHIGGPCARPTGDTRRSDVRAYIVGDNLLAIRNVDGTLCSYTARMFRENRARGIQICERQPRSQFVIRFRSPEDCRPLREVPPDDDILTEEQRRQPDRRFEFRGLGELFDR